jgi:hypothetical protein
MTFKNWVRHDFNDATVLSMKTQTPSYEEVFTGVRHALHVLERHNYRFRPAEK